MSGNAVWEVFNVAVVLAALIMGRASGLGCPPKACIIPGDVDDSNAPQMIIFTYSGVLDMKARLSLTKIFPDRIRNPNGCPVGITAFVVSGDADPCTLHKMYVRGHEIALSGIRRTSRVDNWNLRKWNDSIGVQQKLVANLSHIDEADIVGMRSQEFRPGNNSQFEMLNDNNFVYDSTLLVEQMKNPSRRAHFWPFILEQELLDQLECFGRCPNDSFTGLWEIPASKLYVNDGDRHGCTYLDQCFDGNPSAGDVYDLLKYNYDDVHSDNIAPLQINLRKRNLNSDDVIAGLANFVRIYAGKDGVWMLTMQELIQWMNNPTEKGALKKGFWDCPNRVYLKCSEIYNNKTVKRVTFAEIIDVNHLWIWQTAFLIILYVIVYRYDKYMSEKKKK